MDAAEKQKIKAAHGALTSELAQLQREADELTKDLEDNKERQSAVSQILDGFERLDPSLAPGLVPKRPTTKQAFLATLDSNPKRWWRLPSVLRYMASEGWIDNEEDAKNKVRIAAIRLVKAGMVERERVEGTANSYRYRRVRSTTEEGGE